MIALFHVPRTGGSFLGNYIRDCGLSTHFVPGIGHHCYSDIKEKVAGAFKVAFIREPLDWYVSNYFYFARPDFKTEGGILKGWDDGLSGKDFMRRFPCFEDWLLWLLERDSYSMVLERMLFENGNLKMDYVGKFENLLDDFDKVLKIQLGLTPSVHAYHLQNFNDNKKTNRSFHAPSIQYYTEALIQKVKDTDYTIQSNDRNRI